jgi:hypothetical protein
VQRVTARGLASTWHECCAQVSATAAEKIVMSHPHTPATAPRRLRAAALGTSGGASSLIRLSRAGAVQLPSGAALSLWASRAAASLHPLR